MREFEKNISLNVIATFEWDKYNEQQEIIDLKFVWKEALKNKKHVVTANKALIAKYGDQLSTIAEENNVNLEFEASVAGGIPILRSIKEGLLTNKITKVYGILNGTTNQCFCYKLLVHSFSTSQ